MVSFVFTSPSLCLCCLISVWRFFPPPSTLFQMRCARAASAMQVVGAVLMWLSSSLLTPVSPAPQQLAAQPRNMGRGECHFTFLSVFESLSRASLSFLHKDAFATKTARFVSLDFAAWLKIFAVLPHHHHNNALKTIKQKQKQINKANKQTNNNNKQQKETNKRKTTKQH